MRKMATIIIACVFLLGILGFLFGWLGGQLNDASIALVSAFLVFGTLLLSFLHRKKGKEKRK